jgi:hypothetical protein
MKKLIALIAVLLSVVVPVQSVASNQKALVIIDSYFDSKVSASNVTCITLENAVCTDIVTVKSTSLSSDINHGNAMAEVAKKQNPNLPIILLRSGIVNARSVNGVNPGNFIDALRWVDSNSARVSAVSFSRGMNGPTSCSVASTNTAQFGGVVMADKIIRDLISNLKSKGIPVFVSTGNTSGTKIDYPACINDTISVSVGAFNSKGSIVAAHAYDMNTDYLGAHSVRSFRSTIMGVIPNTTSSSTVGIAAQYATSGFSSSKIVKLIP